MDLIEAREFNRGQAGRRHPWELARLEIIRTLIRRHRAAGSASLRILDFGCGDAFVLRALCVSDGNEGCGIDSNLDQETTERIRREDSRIRLFRSVDEMGKDEKPFDVILLCDVIEHIEDDVQLLRMLAQRSFVSPGTVFVITVPAFQSVFSAHDKWLGHYRRYTVASLRQAIGAAGLKEAATGYFFTSLLLARAVIKWLERFRRSGGQQQGLAGYKAPMPVTKIYYALLRLDFAVSDALRRLGIRLPGLSCYAVCRRQKVG